MQALWSCKGIKTSVWETSMNDFTKTELQIIHIDMTVYCNSMYPLKESPSHKVLRDKIENMIDNYCKHSWRRSAMDAIYCEVCQKHVEYEE